MVIGFNTMCFQGNPANFQCHSFHKDNSQNSTWKRTLSHSSVGTACLASGNNCTGTDFSARCVSHGASEPPPRQQNHHELQIASLSILHKPHQQYFVAEECSSSASLKKKNILNFPIFTSAFSSFSL